MGGLERGYSERASEWVRGWEGLGKRVGGERMGRMCR